MVRHMNDERGLQNVDNLEELCVDEDEQADIARSAFMIAEFIQEEVILKRYGENGLNEH